MPDKKHLIITGAAGFVSGILRKHWGDRYRLRLADIRPIEDPGPDDEVVELDISKYDPFLEACRGIDTVVHLAADPSPRAEFYATLLDRNVIGAYNAFQAASEAGCRRIVFASSVNAVLGYSDDAAVEWDVPVFPTNVYGATKCWGEALGRVYSQHLSCICVRLGSPRFAQNGDWHPEHPTMGISPRDTAQFFQRCVDVEDLPFAIVHALSRHHKAIMGLDATCEKLGYEPRDGTVFPRT